LSYGVLVDQTSLARLDVSELASIKLSAGKRSVIYLANMRAIAKAESVVASARPESGLTPAGLGTTLIPSA
jgi:hypothetical protein